MRQPFDASQIHQLPRNIDIKRRPLSAQVRNDMKPPILREGNFMGQQNNNFGSDYMRQFGTDDTDQDYENNIPKRPQPMNRIFSAKGPRNDNSYLIGQVGNSGANSVQNGIQLQKKSAVEPTDQMWGALNNAVMVQPCKVGQQDIYAENLRLKNKINEQATEIQKLRTELTRIKRDQNKMQQVVEEIEFTGLAKGLGKYGSTQNSALTMNLKRQLTQTKNQVMLKDDEISKLKQTIKYTKIQEIEIERKNLSEETIRLKNLLQQSVNKQMNQMIYQQELVVLEQKYRELKQNNLKLQEDNNQLSFQLNNQLNENADLNKRKTDLENNIYEANADFQKFQIYKKEIDNLLKDNQSREQANFENTLLLINCTRGGTELRNSIKQLNSTLQGKGMSLQDLIETFFSRGAAKISNKEFSKIVGLFAPKEIAENLCAQVFEIDSKESATIKLDAEIIVKKLLSIFSTTTPIEENRSKISKQTTYTQFQLLLILNSLTLSDFYQYLLQIQKKLNQETLSKVIEEVSQNSKCGTEISTFIIPDQQNQISGWEAVSRFQEMVASFVSVAEKVQSIKLKQIVYDLKFQLEMKQQNLEFLIQNLLLLKDINVVEIERQLEEFTDSTSAHLIARNIFKGTINQLDDLDLKLRIIFDDQLELRGQNMFEIGQQITKIFQSSKYGENFVAQRIKEYSSGSLISYELMLLVFQEKGINFDKIQQEFLIFALLKSSKNILQLDYDQIYEIFGFVDDSAQYEQTETSDNASKEKNQVVSNTQQNNQNSRPKSAIQKAQNTQIQQQQQAPQPPQQAAGEPIQSQEEFDIGAELQYRCLSNGFSQENFIEIFRERAVEDDKLEAQDFFEIMFSMEFWPPSEKFREEIANIITNIVYSEQTSQSLKINMVITKLTSLVGGEIQFFEEEEANQYYQSLSEQILPIWEKQLHPLIRQAAQNQQTISMHLLKKVLSKAGVPMLPREFEFLITIIISSSESINSLVYQLIPYELQDSLNIREDSQEYAAENFDEEKENEQMLIDKYANQNDKNKKGFAATQNQKMRLFQQKDQQLKALDKEIIDETWQESEEGGMSNNKVQYRKEPPPAEVYDEEENYYQADEQIVQEEENYNQDGDNARIEEGDNEPPQEISDQAY